FGNTVFEALCLQVTGEAYLYRERYEEAASELNRALALAKERNLDYKIPSLTLDLSHVRFEMGEYDAARQLLAPLTEGSGSESVRARIGLGRIHTRLGDFAAAQADLAAASAAADIVNRPALNAALGELAYESGDLVESRRLFAESAASWNGEMPD